MLMQLRPPTDELIFCVCLFVFGVFISLELLILIFFFYFCYNLVSKIKTI